MGRAPCCEKVGLKRGRWTAEEDEKLRKYIQENGEGCWRSLPKNAGLLRCGKSCRLRWINYLRSDVKRGNISSQEEEIIINLHASMGNRWSLIAAHLPGRTDNEIKNYWNSHLSRKFHGFRPNPQFIPPPPPPPPSSKPKKTKNSNKKAKAAAKTATAAVVMPTTPTPEKESSVGRPGKERESEARESGSSMVGELDDLNMTEDLSGLWGPTLDFGTGSEISDPDPGLGQLDNSSLQIYEETLSWIWDDEDDKWNSNVDNGEMDGAMLSWLLS